MRNQQSSQQRRIPVSEIRESLRAALAGMRERDAMKNAGVNIYSWGFRAGYEAAAKKYRQSNLLAAASDFHETYCPNCPDGSCSLGLALRETQ